MKIVEKHSHYNGLEYLLVHQPKLWTQIQQVIKETNEEPCSIETSKDGGTQCRYSYSLTRIKRKLHEGFRSYQWRERRFSCADATDVQPNRKTQHMPTDHQNHEGEVNGNTPIYSYNQTDFVKDRVAVEVQFGKYSFVAYDLFVKHMAFYVGDLIDVGIEILPMKVLQEQMSSGVAYYEGELYNLIREGRGVPAVPLVLIGIAP